VGCGIGDITLGGSGLAGKSLGKKRLIPDEKDESLVAAVIGVPQLVSEKGITRNSVQLI
jgi:hypothetical protein